jgi:hypothetical protein
VPTATTLHRPYELCFMLVSILIGVGYLTTVPAPTSVVALMPAWVVLLWSTTLAVSGLLVMVGCLWHGHQVVALGLERAGLSAQTGALLIIDGAVVWAWTAGQLATFPLLGVGFLTGWMVANIWRIRQIAATLKHLHLLSLGNAP